MNFRVVVLLATVVVVAGMGWHLMANAGERSSPAAGPTIAVTSMPEQKPPPLPTIDAPTPGIEPQRPASSGIDCTRGVACPIIYARQKGR